MFTYSNFGRKNITPRAFYLHAASFGSNVLQDKNTLDSHFQNALLPEDELIEDAIVRTLSAKNNGNDIELTALLTNFRNLRTQLHHRNAPAPGAPGNMDDIQNRLTADTASLSLLSRSIQELSEAGWEWAGLGTFAKALNAAYAKLPGLKEIKKAYMDLDIAINRFNNVADRHEHITVLSVPEVEKFNSELKEVSGKTIEETFSEIQDLNEQVLEGKLSEIKKKSWYRSYHDQAGFDRKFLSYFSQRLLRKANRDLEVAKEQHFKDRRSEFEGLVLQSRKAAQEYILALDPSNADDLEKLHQIFVTNRRYFELTARKGAANQINPSQDTYTGQQAIIQAISALPNTANAIDIETASVWALARFTGSVAAKQSADAFHQVVLTALKAPWADTASVLAALSSIAIAAPAPLAVNANLDWDSEMTRRVRAILDRYYPDMTKGYERAAITSRIPGMSAPARKIDTLVQAILDQSTAENRLYYGTENLMRKPEELTTWQASVKLLGKAGETLRSFFGSPTTKKWVQGFMGVTKKAVETTVGFAGRVVGSSASIVGDTVLAKTTGFINSKMWSVDSWAWKKREAGFLNTLGWMAKLPARPVTKLGKLLTWTTDGVIGKWVGNIAVSRGVNAILSTGKSAYDKTNEIIAKIPDDEVQDAFSGLGWLMRKSGEWTGKSVEWMGQHTFDAAKTKEMRAILTSLRSGLDESGRAGMQAAQFRAVMGRNWGTGTPHADISWEEPLSPAAPAPAPAPAPAQTAAPVAPPSTPQNSANSIPAPMSKKQVEQAILAVRTKGMRIAKFLDALLKLVQDNPNTSLLRRAYKAALLRKNQDGATIDTVFQEALTVASR